MIIKVRKACTWEMFIAQTFNYGKLAFSILFCLSNIRLAIFYLIYIFILWLVLSNPRYEGPTNIEKIRSKD